MKEYCFNEAKKLGVTPSFCRGKACENYPCAATKEHDQKPKRCAGYGDKMCGKWSACKGCTHPNMKDAMKARFSKEEN